MNRQITGDFEDSENTLYDTIMMSIVLLYTFIYFYNYVIISLSKHMEYETPTVNPKVNYELWKIIWDAVGSSLV